MMIINPHRFGFSPSSLPGLKAWWDAQDTGTITTVGMADAVSALANKGPGTLTLAQVSESESPHLLDVSGRQMLDFDGSADYLSVTDGGALAFGSGNFSIYVVYKTNDTSRGMLFNRGAFAPTGYLCRINNAASNNGELVIQIRDGSSNLAQVSAGATSGTNYNDDTTRLVAVVRNGNDLRQYQDGVEVVESPGNAASVGDIDNGTVFYVGALQGVSGQAYDGQIGEILIYNTVQSEAQRAELTTYLKTKWGIA